MSAKISKIITYTMVTLCVMVILLRMWAGPVTVLALPVHVGSTVMERGTWWQPHFSQLTGITTISYQKYSNGTRAFLLYSSIPSSTPIGIIHNKDTGWQLQ